MKVYLMYADRDFTGTHLPKPDEKGLLPDLIQDLELNTLWDGMAGDDTFLREVAQHATLASLDSVDEIRFRQAVLADCVHRPEVVRELYDLAVEAIVAERRIWRSLFSQRGEALLHRSIEVIQLFVSTLRRLRALAEEHGSRFESAGFRRFFDQVRADLDDPYFAEIEEHLKTLRFKEGTLISARPGVANKGTDYVLRLPRAENRGGLLNRTPIANPRSASPSRTGTRPASRPSANCAITV